MYLLLLSSCTPSQSANTKQELHPIATASDTILLHRYDSLTLPKFFDALYANHQEKIFKINKQRFQWFCDEMKIDSSDATNKYLFNKIDFVHRLFSSAGAFNGAHGDILFIPYMWHWCEPNPRHQITYLPENKLLSEMKPPNGHKKYRSYADVDRTPYLFISEMLSEKPLFSHPDCGEFHTFGWCSEREMAFSSVMETLGMKSHVVVSGNHCWSEVLVRFNTDSESKELILQVDNTFHTMNWRDSDIDLLHWKTLPTSGTPKWYNDKCHYSVELNGIRSFIVTPVVSERIENSVVDFFEMY